MALYVYKTDGSLYSWSPNDTDPVADAATLTANGLTSASGLPALDPAHAWDASSKTVISVTPPPTTKPISTGKWILRFTPQEFQVINASTDAMVQQFMYALNHTTNIDLSDPDMVNGVSYLVSLSLLGAARVAAILAASS
jgi:hypothetical protein